MLKQTVFLVPALGFLIAISQSALAADLPPATETGVTIRPDQGVVIQISGPAVVNGVHVLEGGAVGAAAVYAAAKVSLGRTTAQVTLEAIRDERLKNFYAVQAARSHLSEARKVSTASQTPFRRTVTEAEKEAQIASRTTRLKEVIARTEELQAAATRYGKVSVASRGFALAKGAAILTAAPVVMNAIGVFGQAQSQQSDRLLKPELTIASNDLSPVSAAAQMAR